METQRVTTTYTMSNGKIYAVEKDMIREQLHEAHAAARSIASSHMPIVVTSAGGSAEYLNPTQVASIHIEVSER